jgi:hypothetical protein
MRNPKIVDGFAMRVSSVAGVVDRMVRQEMLDRGIKRPDAERVIARETGLSPGTLENLRRERLKNLGWISTSINAALIKRTERKIAQLEHELALARQIADRPDSNDIFAAQAALDTARRLIGKGVLNESVRSRKTRDGPARGALL